MMEIKVGLPRASRNLVNEKEVCTSFVKIADLMIKLYYKSYCSILKRVIRGKKSIF
jgi:hypothetical protein